MKLNVEDLKRLIREQVAEATGIFDQPTFKKKVKAARTAGKKKPEAYVATVLRQMKELPEEVLRETGDPEVFEDALKSLTLDMHDFYSDLSDEHKEVFNILIGEHGQELVDVIRDLNLKSRED